MAECVGASTHPCMDVADSSTGVHDYLSIVTVNQSSQPRVSPPAPWHDLNRTILVLPIAIHIQALMDATPMNMRQSVS